jgi:hypothetical protein
MIDQSSLIIRCSNIKSHTHAHMHMHVLQMTHMLAVTLINVIPSLPSHCLSSSYASLLNLQRIRLIASFVKGCCD